MPVIGRNDIVDEVAAKTGYTQRDVTAILNSLLSTILTRLIHAGDTISIHNFGRFFMSDVAAREGRDPRTGETISLPGRRRIRFQASKVIRDELTGK